MEKQKMKVYWDKEADYLEIRFGEPTPSHYEKIGQDTFIKIDEKTGEGKGFAIFNVQKSEQNILEVDIPLDLLKLLHKSKTKAMS